MKQHLFKNKETKKLFLILLIIFILTECIDLTLDKLFGNSISHSILQFLLFIVLFFLTYYLFILFEQKKVKKLIPNELMEILKIIYASKQKGIVINHRKIRETLSVTKPTLKKRIDALLSLEYITFEEKGNHKYFYLTPKGESILQ